MPPSATRKAGPDRRQRILDAARYLVLRHGLRATTMEAIAREAQVAKPTLYSYFADKESVFGGIVTELIGAVISSFETALRGEGDVVTRIGNAVAAKYRVIAKLLEGSPHADELYGEHERSAAAQFRAVEQKVEAAIAGELEQAGVARPRQLAQLLLAAAQGVGRRATSATEIGPAIRLLTDRLVGPEVRDRHSAIGSRQS